MKNRNIKIVLLGATGFVGSALLSRLSHRNDSNVQVSAMVRGEYENFFFPFLDIINGELPDRIPSTIFPDEPHVVVHFATQKIVNPDIEEVNIRGTENLLNKFTKSTLGIIYASSMSVYGQGEQTGVDENRDAKPDTPLALSRVKAEEMIIRKAEQNNICAYILRTRVIIGKNDLSSLPGYINMVKNGLIIGNGTQKFSIISVNDYADIILQLVYSIYKRMEINKPLRRPFHLCYEKPIQLNSIIDEICNAMLLKKPWKKLPVFKWFFNLLHALPGGIFTDLATRLELTGLSHYGKPDKLSMEIGKNIISKDPTIVFRQTLKEYLKG